MRYVLAVSGGVDSVVLLHMMRQRTKDELIVAHFDHGIRPDSAQDATFVRDLATMYGVAYETRREELGEGASEELARARRYSFLKDIASKHGATIMTAHHADDVVETIAINLKRGTGWRGIAVMDSVAIERPLLSMRKSELVAYANSHSLEWREDSTNNDRRYLRNDLRARLTGMTDDKHQLLQLYRDRQVVLKRWIDTETAKLVGQSPYDRYFFTVIPEMVALELLRHVFAQETGSSPTTPQRVKALLAIKTSRAGGRLDVGDGIILRFTKTTFIVEVTPRVLS